MRRKGREEKEGKGGEGREGGEERREGRRRKGQRTFLNLFSRSVRRNTCSGCSALCSRLEETWDKCIASDCSWSRIEDQWVLRELWESEGGRGRGREGEREGGRGG